MWKRFQPREGPRRESAFNQEKALEGTFLVITNVGKDLRLKLFLVAVRSDILMRDLGENLNSFIQLIDSRGAASTGGRDRRFGNTEMYYV